MCWPCCWPCLVVDDPPLLQQPNSNSNSNSHSEKFAPRQKVSRRRAFGEIAATKGLAPQPRASRRSRSRSHSTTRQVITATAVSTSQHKTRRPRSVSRRATGTDESNLRQNMTRRRTSERIITTAGNSTRETIRRPSTAEDDLTPCQTVSSRSDTEQSYVAERGVPREMVPTTFDDAPDAWLTPSMVGIAFIFHPFLLITLYISRNMSLTTLCRGYLKLQIFFMTI